MDATPLLEAERPRLLRTAPRRGTAEAPASTGWYRDVRRAFAALPGP